MASEVSSDGAWRRCEGRQQSGFRFEASTLVHRVPTQPISGVRLDLGIITNSIGRGTEHMKSILQTGGVGGNSAGRVFAPAIKGAQATRPLHPPRFSEAIKRHRQHRQASIAACSTLLDDGDRRTDRTLNNNGLWWLWPSWTGACHFAFSGKRDIQQKLIVSEIAHGAIDSERLRGNLALPGIVH